jgi:hypothetical protein
MLHNSYILSNLLYFLGTLFHSNFIDEAYIKNIEQQIKKRELRIPPNIPAKITNWSRNKVLDIILNHKIPKS